MFEAGAIVGRMLLDTSGFESSMGRVSTLAQAFPTAVGSFLGTTLSSITSMAIRAGFALVDMIGNGIGMGVKLAADMEQAEVAFGVLLGSTQKAKALLKDLSDFAASTPFEFPELQRAARSLAAFGVEQEKILPTLRAVGDVSSGINQPIAQIAEIFGKAKVQGRLFMEDINQLTGRGVPIIGELAKQFGVAESAVRGMVEGGRVNFGHLEKAFESLSGKGGMFEGMMAKQSQTLVGLWSTMKDGIGTMMRDVAAALMEGLDVKGGIGRVGEMFQAMSGPAKAAAQEIGSAIAPLLPQLMELGQMLLGSVVAGFRFLGQVVQENQPAIRQFYAFIGELLPPVLQSLAPLLGGLARVLYGVGSTMMTVVTPALQVVLPIVELISKVVGTLLDLLGRLLGKIGELMRVNLFNPLSGVLSLASGWVSSSSPAASPAGDSAQGKAAGQVPAAVGQSPANQAAGSVGQLGQASQSLAASVGQAAGSIEPVAGQIGAALSRVGEVGKGTLLPAMEALSRVMDSLHVAMGPFLADLEAMLDQMVNRTALAGSASGGSAVAAVPGGQGADRSSSGTIRIDRLVVEAPPLDEASTLKIAEAIRGPLRQAIVDRQRQTEGALAASRMAGGL